MLEYLSVKPNDITMHLQCICEISLGAESQATVSALGEMAVPS